LLDRDGTRAADAAMFIPNRTARIRRRCQLRWQPPARLRLPLRRLRASRCHVHSRVSDRKIAARCPDAPRDQVKCRQSPDYHDLTISSGFSATDQPGRRSALLTPNWRGHQDRLRVQRPDAGFGGVSVFALQFARLLGARVIATTSTTEKAERLKGVGGLLWHGSSFRCPDLNTATNSPVSEEDCVTCSPTPGRSGLPPLDASRS